MSTPIWISHRGYCERASENTMEAFDAATALGFDHLETDLRTTLDGHILLLHDSNLARLAGQPWIVEQSTREQLESVRLLGGERLVFLDQWLPAFSHCRWILDIKPESALQTVQQLMPWWDQPAYQSFFDARVRFLFWRKEHQDALLRHKPHAVCMARLGQCRRAGITSLLGMASLGDITRAKTYAIPPNFHGIRPLRPRVLAQFRNRGARILAYLPETDEEVHNALSANVDEILTNHRPLEHA